MAPSALCVVLTLVTVVAAPEPGWRVAFRAPDGTAFERECPFLGLVHAEGPDGRESYLTGLLWDADARELMPAAASENYLGTFPPGASTAVEGPGYNAGAAVERRLSLRARGSDASVSRLPSFWHSLARGAEGEHVVARLLVEQGFAVVPNYVYERSALVPSVLAERDGESVSLATPDLLCVGPAGTFWCEVKRKSRWVQRAPGGPLETGFDLRSFESYGEVSRLTGAPVVVFFVHETHEPCGLFYQRLDRLAPNVRVWDGRAPNGAQVSRPLALFPRGALETAGDGAFLVLP